MIGNGANVRYSIRDEHCVIRKVKVRVRLGESIRLHFKQHFSVDEGIPAVMLGMIVRSPCEITW